MKNDSEKEQVSVVIIEDDPDDVFLIEELLKDSRLLDCKVSSASTFLAGMEAINQDKGDVYLIDQHLGAEMGVSLIEEARGRGIKKPLILLTGNDSPEVDQEAQRAGANDYILKFELTTSVLERAIRYGLAQWNLLRNQEQLIRETLARLEAEKREAQWHLLGESLPYGFWLTDIEGRLEYISRSFLKLLGVEGKSSYPGFNYSELLSEELQDRWQKALQSGAKWNAELEITSDKGKTVYILSKGMPIRNSDGVIVQWVGINLDVTREKRLEKRKDDFLRIASHELKSPITSILSSLYTLRDELKIDDQSQGWEYVTRMQRQLGNMTRLVEDLLDLSKIEMKKLSFYPEIFCLNDLLDEVVELLEAQTDHEIRIKMHDDIYIEADRQRLNQVMVNLITNAIKYSPHAKDVEVKISEQGGSIVIEVADRGIGIPEHELSKIFEKFYSGEEEEARKIGGLGLGLFLTRKIIELHGGSISVSSKVRKGSTFTVILPKRRKERVNPPSGKGKAQ